MDQADGQAQLRRRGMLTGLAALVGAAAAKLLGAERAEATHTPNVGNPGADSIALHVGQTNTTSAHTVLQRQNGDGSSTLTLTNSNGVGIITSSGNGAGLGGYGSPPGDTLSGAGVFGTIGGSQYDPGAGGVVGLSSTWPGVIGQSDNSSAVRGIAGVPTAAFARPRAGVEGNSAPAIGVAGLSGSQIGVFGRSLDNVGVRGQSTNSTGVYGTSSFSVGVRGDSPNYIGVYGQSNGGVAVWGSSSTNYALYGVSTSGIGVYGSSGSYIGISASSGTSTGLFASSNSGLAAYFQGPVQVQGNFTVLPGFAKSVAVPHPDGSTRRMYCMESPESYFEDFGEGRLVNGRAAVTLDDDFAAVVQGDKYQVFVMPEGDCNGVYIASKSRTGFEVRELKAGTSTLSFSYRVVAKRKDIVGPRMERVDLSVRPERPARSRIQEPPAPPAPAADLPPDPPRPAPNLDRPGR